MKKAPLKRPLLSLSYDEFRQWWQEQGHGLAPCRRLVSQLVRQKKTLPLLLEEPEISDSLIQKINESFEHRPLELVQRKVSKDQTIKYLFSLSDGLKIESVAVPFFKKYTLCLSSQVGCAMGCRFCFTAEQGLSRNLKPFEIVGQYLFIWRDLQRTFGHPCSPNIVFMGQGEPLHNFDNLKKAIFLFLDYPGLSLGPGQITVSTVGHIPGLKRWEELPPIHLALSLHSPFEKERSSLMPANRAWPLEELMETLAKLPWHQRRRINFEYLLLGGVNDSKDHADALAEKISPFPCLVNLISFNPYPGSPYRRPEDSQVQQFKRWLVSHKVRTMIRKTKGDSILAACGQLANTVHEEGSSYL